MVRRTGQGGRRKLDHKAIVAILNGKMKVGPGGAR